MQKKDKTKRNASRRNKMHEVHGEIKKEGSKAQEVHRRGKKRKPTQKPRSTERGEGRGN